MSEENSKQSNESGLSLHYYGSWGSYTIPVLPQEPLTEDEAKGRSAYYIGYYDINKQLVRFEKYYDGTLDWADNYTYWDNGKLKTRVMIKADGSQVSQDYDPKGKIIL